MLGGMATVGRAAGAVSSSSSDRFALAAGSSASAGAGIVARGDLPFRPRPTSSVFRPAASSSVCLPLRLGFRKLESVSTQSSSPRLRFRFGLDGTYDDESPTSHPHSRREPSPSRSEGERAENRPCLSAPSAFSSASRSLGSSSRSYNRRESGPSRSRGERRRVRIGALDEYMTRSSFAENDYSSDSSSDSLPGPDASQAERQEYSHRHHLIRRGRQGTPHLDVAGYDDITMEEMLSIYRELEDAVPILPSIDVVLDMLEILDGTGPDRANNNLPPFPASSSFFLPSWPSSAVAPPSLSSSSTSSASSMPSPSPPSPPPPPRKRKRTAARLTGKVSKRNLDVLKDVEAASAAVMGGFDDDEENGLRRSKRVRKPTRRLAESLCSW